jgi:hypothetical protein
VSKRCKRVRRLRPCCCLRWPDVTRALRGIQVRLDLRGRKVIPVRLVCKGHPAQPVLRVRAANRGRQDHLVEACAWFARIACRVIAL